jgi:hypothetical protein
MLDLANFLDGCKSTAYAGIGSRQTHPDVLALMTRIATYLDRRFWMLRSGGAEGADTAFENGVHSMRKQVFLPWPGFNGRRVGVTPYGHAYRIAEQYHPNWHNLDRSVRSLHARNVHQILGPHCDDPSGFVVCWTPDGSTGETTSRTGGTGQALRIAKAYGISIFNLQREDHRVAWWNLVKGRP